MNAKLNETITRWTEGYSGLLRRLERNRFLFIFEKRDLERAKENKFSLLEDIHEIVNSSGLPASISIGLGVDGESFEESYDFAALGIEMALSRGGDQAVIKGSGQLQFLRRAEPGSGLPQQGTFPCDGQFPDGADRPERTGVHYGTQNADLDAGRGHGHQLPVPQAGKKANIVIDLENNAAGKLIEEIQAVPEYRDVFVSGQDALLMADNRSILVVVDTNRPDQVECRPLLEAISKVCVVDHHRRAADYINPVVVNLHEPYASSAAELVTEVLMYAVEKKDVLPIEAESLMAGICLDTKFFNVRTGERTFEAAAVLRRLGADTTEVKKLMQNDFQDTMAKYQIIKSSRLYRQEIAIAALNTPPTRCWRRRRRTSY